MTHISLAFVLGILIVAAVQAETGPCTKNVIQDGKTSYADDEFSYMPPYGKPVTGQDEIQKADDQSFSDRTNIQHKWLDDHRIVSSELGDMAYEHGTLHMSSDSKSKPGAAGHEEFDAVMLIVYKANKGTCQQVALTMQPLEQSTRK